MDVKELVGQAWDALYSEGTPMPGCQLAETEAVIEVQRRFPHKPYCLVRQWALIDLECPAAAVTLIERSGRRPTVVFAHCIVSDSAHRGPPGNWIRSTFEVSRDDSAGLFESRNTVYVLLGPGTRRTAPLGVVMSIH